LLHFLIHAIYIVIVKQNFRHSFKKNGFDKKNSNLRLCMGIYKLRIELRKIKLKNQRTVKEKTVEFVDCLSKFDEKKK